MSDEMPESITPTEPGMPSPLVTRVLDEAQALLGQHEEGGANQGRIVEIVAEPFLSRERLARYMTGGDRAGDLAWCSLFASYCWWRAWPEFKPYASSEVSGLWENFSAVDGWCWQKGEGRLLEPQAGDFIFFVKTHPRTGLPLVTREGKPAFRHVGLVKRFVDGEVVCVEGNATDAVRERRYHLGERQIHGFGRPRPT